MPENARLDPMKWFQVESITRNRLVRKNIDRWLTNHNIINLAIITIKWDEKSGNNLGWSIKGEGSRRGHEGVVEGWHGWIDPLLPILRVLSPPSRRLAIRRNVSHHLPLAPTSFEWISSISSTNRRNEAIGDLLKSNQFELKLNELNVKKQVNAIKVDNLGAEWNNNKWCR